MRRSLRMWKEFQWQILLGSLPLDHSRFFCFVLLLQQHAQFDSLPELGGDPSLE